MPTPHLAALLSVTIPMGLGLLLDRLLGEPPHHHPLVGFGRYASAIERLFRRLGANRGIGLLAWSAAILPWVALAGSLRESNIWLGLLLDVGLLYFAIGSRSLAEHARAVATPLLAGEIRSVFFMTEPDVASSDATNMAATAVIEGDEIVLNGKKWWSSGVGDPRCKIGIFMAATPNPDLGRHNQHSMVLVPMDTPGVTITRMLPVFGAYDEPHGHGEVHFTNVRVPLSNFIAGPGKGFEIAQGRLGPGRIHHCMRCLGAAEKSLELAIKRGVDRVAFKKQLINLGGNRERIADARVAIDQARLLTLQAAWKIDTYGVMAALTDVSSIKVVAPTVLQNVVDFAIQMHGGAGVSHDTPLTGFFAQARSLRLADGPDEVHKGMIARLELMKYGVMK